jgi:N4-gp56 family major capsid protein
MATTDYGVNHALAVKIWTKRLLREALKETHCGRFMGTSTNSLIQVKSELRKQAGDRIRVGLRMQLSGDGVQGDDTLEGNEEALTTYSDDIFVDQLRHAVRSGGRMSDQRVPFSVREEALDGLRDWWADRLDESFFNQIAGNTGQTDTKRTGNQTALAPSSGLHLFGNADMTTEASLTASTAGSSFQLTMLDDAVAIAKVNSPVIRPVRVGGRSVYVAFLHPYQIHSMRTDATASRITWYDINTSRIRGGEMDNPIFNGALGEYNGVIIHENTRVPLAPSTTAVRRAIFCGAQAACFASGRDNRPNTMTWVEELFDYENELGVSAGMIYGLKKLQFNSADFGTIVLSTYAAAPS